MSSTAAESLPLSPVLRLRRHASFAIIGLLSLFGLYHLAVQPALSGFVTGVPYINSYGRQRMLSQRLCKALLAAQYGLPQLETQKSIQEVRDSLDEWASQHRDLLTHDIGYLPPTEIRQSIRRLDLHFLTMFNIVEEFLNLVNQDPDSPKLHFLTENLLQVEPHYLVEMNRIVGLYEAEVRRRVSDLRMSGWIIFGLLVAIAIFLHCRILSPAFGSLASLYSSNLSRYRTLVENMNDGLVLVDRFGTVHFANRRLLILLELSEEHLIGQRLDDFLVPGAHARSSLLNAIESQGTTESRFKRKLSRDPLDLFVRCQSVAIDPNDVDHLILLVLTDITEEKHGRERMKELQNQLARVNRLKSIGEMTASLAHEIGQPICAISAFVGSCRNRVNSRDIDPGKIDDELQRIELAAARAADILNRFRNYGRLSPQTLVPLDFPTLVADIDKLCQPLLAHSSARIVSEIAQPLPRIEGDQLLIQQVLINIIQNSLFALEDLPAERRTLALKITPSDSSGLEITLIDRGKGISAVDMSRMQEAFFTTRPDGLGLGLAICRTIIEDHEGHLCITSEVGVGTIVKISLPLVRRENARV